MSGFDIAWLDLREGADKAARNGELARAALNWLQRCRQDGLQEPVVVDLGAGTGATLRALSALGAGRLVWRLVDNDGVLLDEALRRHGKTCTIEDYQADLAVVNELPLGGVALVTASALFDLVSRNFVERLVGRLRKTGSGLYAALSYDGQMQWQPVHPLDSAVLEAFNHDQTTDKGLGPALGPAAGACLLELLEQAGFVTSSASSPWLLDGSEHALVAALTHGIAAAVADGYGLDAEALQDWQRFRLAHALTGSCRIGHTDILGLPAADC